MDELVLYFFVYGYMLPLLIMLIWMLWCIYTDLKDGKKYMSYYLMNCWPLLIPGVSLFAACMLLLLAIEEGSHWLEKHWKPWREAGERLRRIASWLCDKIIKED